mmetsp:Transcript_24556/g.31913  ORF Transcript_24556/g.31913 Transcript_24556/m.31913 type:complete len:405 (-) Transcript_24556:320-1534(-)
MGAEQSTADMKIKQEEVNSPAPVNAVDGDKSTMVSETEEYSPTTKEKLKAHASKYVKDVPHHHKCCHAIGLIIALYLYVIVSSVYNQSRPPVGVEPQAIAKKAKANEDADDDSFYIKKDFKFEPYALAFSPYNAYQLGRCSSLVYYDRSNVTSTLKRWGFSKSKFWSVNDTEVFLAQSDHTIIMAFRGTSSVEDALTDLDFTMEKTKHGYVHSGFYEAINFVWDDLYNTLQTFQNNTKGSAIFVTGHSLGAALATIATARLRLDHDEPVHGLYTFGSPRVFDETYAIKFNKDFGAQSFRFVNQGDIVTKVPLAQLFGYRHVGRMFYLDVDGTIIQRISFWELLLDVFQEKLKDILGLFRLDFSPGNLEDHYMAGYISGISKNLEDSVCNCEIGIKGACKNAWVK